MNNKRNKMWMSNKAIINHYWNDFLNNLREFEIIWQIAPMGLLIIALIAFPIVGYSSFKDHDVFSAFIYDYITFMIFGAWLFAQLFGFLFVISFPMMIYKIFKHKLYYNKGLHLGYLSEDMNRAREARGLYKIPRKFEDKTWWRYYCALLPSTLAFLIIILSFILIISLILQIPEIGWRLRANFTSE